MRDSTPSSSKVWGGVCKIMGSENMISIQGGYPDSFDAVIIANTLHIMLEPEKALPEIKRVL